MAIGYKNLILIDNSKSMGEPNFMLCRETAKYICNNIAAEDSCRVAVFGEDVEYLTDYTTDSTLLTGIIDGITMYNRDTYVTDILVKILAEWEEQDVACRNIILFTDGGEEESVLHANEELYYMLSEAGYPVYIVQSVESKAVAANRNLSAISRISGGKLLLTEFEGSDGGSEKIMGEEILTAINDNRESVSEEEPAQTGKASDAQDGPEENTDVNTEEDIEESTVQGTDEDVYIINDTEVPAAVRGPLMTEEKQVDPPIIRNTEDSDPKIGFNVVFPALGLMFAVVFAAIIYFISKRNSRVLKRDKKVFSEVNDDLDIEARIAEAAEDYDCLTYKFDGDCAATTLLEQTEGACDITLEDCSDPTRLYRASCDDSLIVGRAQGLCDIVIDHDDSVSGRHCELSVRNGSWYVRDLMSSNGTKVNNQKVFQELMLKTGDILQLGRLALQVSI